MHFDEMVKVDNITVTSTCEHHFVVMDGYAKVAYMPSDKIIGLSKSIVLSSSLVTDLKSKRE